MKTGLSFLLVVIVAITLYSCDNKRKNKVSDKESIPSIEQPTGQHGNLLVESNGPQMQQLYEQMDEIPLPFIYNRNFMANAPGFIKLPENMFSLFHNFDSFNTNTRIAKLAEKGDIKPLLILYEDDNGNQRMNIYTLSDSMKVIDRLQISSIEVLDNNAIIQQEFEIPEDYKIMVRKSLGDEVIEQLYYTVDEHKCFFEIRDGKTPAIAFESPDNKRYMVESFIWDHHNNGGLYKKDLQRQFYKMNDKNMLTVISETEYNQ